MKLLEKKPVRNALLVTIAVSGSLFFNRLQASGNLPNDAKKVFELSPVIPPYAYAEEIRDLSSSVLSKAKALDSLVRICNNKLEGETSDTIRSVMILPHGFRDSCEKKLLEIDSIMKEATKLKENSEKETRKMFPNPALGAAYYKLETTLDRLYMDIDYFKDICDFLSKPAK